MSDPDQFSGQRRVHHVGAHIADSTSASPGHRRHPSPQERRIYELGVAGFARATLEAKTIAPILTEGEELAHRSSTVWCRPQRHRGGKVSSKTAGVVCTFPPGPLNTTERASPLRKIEKPPRPSLRPSRVPRSCFETRLLPSSSCTQRLGKASRWIGAHRPKRRSPFDRPWTDTSTL